MTQTIKKRIALLLAVVQLFVLFPILQPQVRAAEQTANETPPAINRVTEGTLRFRSFHFKGDKTEQIDGLDYALPFYYSDDFFAPSASNPNSTEKVMDWTDLEDLSLAYLSECFSLACFASCENSYPLNWENKEKNARLFLQDCDFGNYFENRDCSQPTGTDTLGYVFSSKTIHVWDEENGNETYTLVAVGVRGGGYGGEWGSNLKIGNPDGPEANDRALSGTYAHQGFTEGKNRILSDLETYTENLSGKVKYWVCGYSRGGAVANLVAGAITDQAGKYHTTQDDVFGYTFEAPAGAHADTDLQTGTKYPNIHNIINKLDVVPLLSPELFRHIRLGTDYRLPYYQFKNTENAYIDTYYANMYQILKDVADSEQAGLPQDTVIANADPNAFPYNSKIQLYQFHLTNPIPSWLGGGGQDGFTNTITNDQSSIDTNGLMIDRFEELFVETAFLSRAWDAALVRKVVESGWFSDTTYYYSDQMTNDWDSHEQQYVKNYQNAIRTLCDVLFGDPLLSFSSLKGIFQGLSITSVFTDFGVSNTLNLITKYNAMHNADKITEDDKYTKAVTELQDPLYNILIALLNKADIFTTAQMDKMKPAIRTLLPVITWLYCEDHKDNDGEYLGTLMENTQNVFLSHIPEFNVSWLMSLDDMLISDYREITLPASAAITVSEFRPGIDDAFLKDSHQTKIEAAEAAGAEIGVLLNGTFVGECLDARVTAELSADGQTVTVRYPGTLDVRFDVDPLGSETAFAADALSDWTPGCNVTNVKAICVRAGQNDPGGLNPTNIRSVSLAHDRTAQYYTASAAANNELLSTLTLEPQDSLRVMAWHGSNQVEDSYEAEYALFKNAERTYVADFAGMTVAEDATLTAGSGFTQSGDDVLWKGSTALAAGANLAMSGVESARVLGKPDETKSTQLYWSEDVHVIPASSVYFDDSLNGETLEMGDGHGWSAAITGAGTDTPIGVVTVAPGESPAPTEQKTITYTFRGTGIDVYCTTDSQSGYIQATLKQDGEQVGNSVIVRCYSQTERYNVPTVSFRVADADYGEYTLELNVLPGANYKLDGVRIYNPLGTVAQPETQTVYKDTTEGNAQYVNLRDCLVNESDAYDVSGNVASGVLFVDDTKHLITQKIGEDGKPHDMYTPVEAYKVNGPKHEIYLAPSQAITFSVGQTEGAHYWVGLSAPDKDHTSGSVLVNRKRIDVTSATDMYYEVTDKLDFETVDGETSAVVLIENNSAEGTAISVTNFKVTSPVAPAKLGRAMFNSVSASVLSSAYELSVLPAEEDVQQPAVETPEVTPDPTPDFGELVRQLISSFVESLFSSISRLFG